MIDSRLAPNFARSLERRVAQSWPGFSRLGLAAQRRVLTDIVGLGYSAPLALVAMVWLSRVTDWAMIVADWPRLLALATASALLSAVPFVHYLQRRSGTASWIQANLQPIVLVSALLLVGPAALWIDIAQEILLGARAWLRRPPASDRWNIARNRMFNLAATPLSFLAALACYTAVGGALPLPPLTAPAAARATLLMLIAIGAQLLLSALYQLIVAWLGLQSVGWAGVGSYVRFLILTMLPAFGYAILAAAVAQQVGFGAYLFLLSGVFLASLLARRWSLDAERSYQRSHELVHLEQLGRALLLAPPDDPQLAAALAAAVPAMIQYDQLEIQLADGASLISDLGGAPAAPPAFWAWVSSAPQAQTFAPGAALPWDAEPAQSALTAVSILPVADGPPIGGILVRQAYLFDTPSALLPTLQTLAAQIAAAIERSAAYTRDLALRQVQQELALAAQIQASFLPKALPTLPGWQIAAALRPARQTSGDFYDVFALPTGRIVFIVADVADKGTGPALFMALTRTLLRTYAFAYPESPAEVLAATNRRMLDDAHSSIFVTAFYGLLDPATGALTYANAGQNPPLRSTPGAALMQRLTTTGIPLGIEADRTWGERTVRLGASSALVLYSDGVTEAQDRQGAFYEEERLSASISVAPDHAADALLGHLLDQLAVFVDGAAQSDDITLLVLCREPARSRDRG